MNEEKLIDALYKKMHNELEAYHSWLTTLSPDEIIDRGYGTAKAVRMHCYPG